MNVEPTEFKFEDRRTNQEKYLHYRKRKGTLIHSFAPGVGLYQLPRHFILFDDDRKLILYFVKFNVKSIFGHKFAIQEILWASGRVADKQYTVGGVSVGEYVFFHHLLAAAEGVGIATDSMQTAGGKRFWFRRVAQAFADKQFVYLIDQNTRVKVLVSNYDDFEAKITNMKTWTDGQAGEGRRVIIAPKKIW